MGSFSIWHWLIVLVVVLILFGGGGKLSRLAGDLAKGITSFRKGLKDGNEAEAAAATTATTGQTATEPPKPLQTPGTGPVVEGVKRDETVRG
ncbi:MAG: twin-arginine translocase TatA/TatE family subunit [Alphaproteobacteria bacterium]|nr:twin-arginine translocase TatA/TatE family subunit [Alphaproteobacteria bacterium]